MHAHSRDCVRFDRFMLDLAGGALWDGDQRLNLRPKSFEVLCHLVRNAGRVVGKDELLDGVWPQVHVTEDSLTRCVSEVRTALGDTDQKFIETVPKRGYIFLASVIPPGLGDAVPALPGSGVTPGNATPSVAVLRFETLSADGGSQRMPTYRSMFVWLAAAAAMAGHVDEASQAAARVRTQQSSFTIQAWLDFIRLPDRDGKLLAEGLLRAGFSA